MTSASPWPGRSLEGGYPLHLPPSTAPSSIHCAFLSSITCASNLIATRSCLLLTPSRCRLIRPTLAKMHNCTLPHSTCWDKASTYWPTMVPRRWQDTCLSVERQMWATLTSAQVWTSAWRSSEPSPHFQTTKLCSSPKDWNLIACSGTTSPVCISDTFIAKENKDIKLVQQQTKHLCKCKYVE